MKYIPKETIKELCSKFDGRCSLHISIPFAGETFEINSGEQFRSASTIKIPLLALLLKDAEEGRIDIDRPIPLGEEGAVRGAGVIKYLSRDIRLSLYDYATLMIIVSDNTATNQVIDAVGIERANAFFAENGWHDTHLEMKLFVPTPGHEHGTASTNTTSAKDLADMLTRIHNKTMISQGVSEKMLSIMACQQLGKLDKSIPNVWRPSCARAPITDIPEGNVLMAQKGGTLLGIVSHDTAIMMLPNGKSAIIVVMTDASGDKAIDLMKEISLAVYKNLI